MGFESQILFHLSKLSQIPVLSDFLFILNKLGKGDVLAFYCILLIIAGYFSKKPRWIKTGGGGILLSALVGLFVQSLKYFFGRARPQMNFGDMHFIGPNLFRGGYDSFPSGHAFNSFALASFFSFYYPKLKIPFYTTAFLISFMGRLIPRYHFPSDVIVGGCLGVGLGLYLAKKLENWVSNSAVPDAPPALENEFESVKGSDLKTHLKNLLIVAAFSSAILFCGLNKSALWDRDETEYAQAVIEMQQKNEWFIPTLEGQPFLEKPILMYWFEKISLRLFGTNEFAFRFPCALFGVLTCLGTYLLANALWGSTAGLLSALILASSLLFAGGFKLLLTDPFFVFFSLMSFVFYVYAQRKKANLYRILSYGVMGLGVLAKGPIAFFPMVVFLIFERSSEKKSLKDFLTQNFLLHALYSLIPIAIAAPWFLYMFKTQAQATETFFLYENIHRFLSGSEGHTGPMIYYVLILIPGFLPWTFFTIPYIKKEWLTRTSKNLPMDSGTLLLSIWGVFIFIFFSFSAHKLPHYLFPLLPPLSCLIGKFWRNQDEEDRRLTQTSLVITIAVSLFLIISLTAGYFIKSQYASFRLLLPFILFCIFLLGAFLSHKLEQLKKSFVLIGLSSLCFFISASFFSLPWIENFRVAKPIGLAVKSRVSAEEKLVGYKFSEPSLFLYGNRLFPTLDDISLDKILNDAQPVFVILRESDLKKAAPNFLYEILERREGFAENWGELTLLLIRNVPQTKK